MTNGRLARIERWRAHARLWLQLAFARRDAALQELDAWLVRDPDDTHALASRAHLLAESGRPADAIVALRRVVALQPARAAAWFNLGFLLESVGQAEDACASFTRALELDPALDRAWYGLGLALVRLERDDEAIQAFETNTRLQPMSPHGWIQLARLQLRRGARDEALRILRHLGGFEPGLARRVADESGLVEQGATTP